MLTVASLRTALVGRYFPLPLVLFLTIAAEGCATATTPQGEEAATPKISAREVAPGIPDLPDLVTVVPFYSKPNETGREQTLIAMPVEIDGVHGIVLLDLGAALTTLNRTFLQPNSIGGVDSITDDNKIPDHTSWGSIGTVREWEKVHVTMRIGTLLVNYEDPDLNNAARVRNPYQYNAMLGHVWDNFEGPFAPRLGHIGPTALQQFETIIDYKNRQVVLIRLDSKGHRMAVVPAYLPRWAAPLVPVKYYEDMHTWGLAVGPQNTLDTLNTAHNTKVKMLDTGTPDSDERLLGYDFLSNLGVFGINQRTQQFFLYF